MAALTTGVLAPDFRLPTIDGRQISLAEARKRGPVVLSFFKVSCPVCQYAFPLLERVHQLHKGGNVTFLGVSQNDRKDTNKFLREYGVTFPVALDDTAKYAVSNAYGLTNVPTVFYIAPEGEIEISSVGWTKADVEAIHRRLTEHRNHKPTPLWRKHEEISDFRAG